MTGIFGLVFLSDQVHFCVLPQFGVIWQLTYMIEAEGQFLASDDLICVQLFHKEHSKSKDY